MPKRSRKLAARQAALAGRKKLRQLARARSQVEPTSQPSQPTAVEPVEIEEPASDSDTVDTASAPEPAAEEVEEPVTTLPWPYAYVLRDLRKTGIVSAGIFVVIGILTVILG